LQGKNDKITDYAGLTMSKKDDSKGSQKANDYKIVTTKNTFLPLADFPPLSYKATVTNSPANNACDNYFT